MTPQPHHPAAVEAELRRPGPSILSGLSSHPTHPQGGERPFLFTGRPSRSPHVGARGSAKPTVAGAGPSLILQG